MADFDREMQRALELDGEKLRQLTGEDHGPETLFECSQCCGEGVTRQATMVYEHGCGFPHEDVEETPCQSCNGAGFFIAAAKPDATGECPICNGDCAGANPPPIFCPILDPVSTGKEP